MSRKICINASEILTRIALLENGKPVEVFLESPRERCMVGNIYIGIVTKVLPGMQAAFVNIGLEKDAFLFVQNLIIPSVDLDDDVEDADDIIGEVDLNEHEESVLNQSIEKLVHEGQRILVQVTRGPMEMKGARITAQVTFPGRYIVLMPNVNNTGVSKRIELQEERDRLKSIAETIRPEDVGLIVRTAAEGSREADFQADLKHLIKIWERVRDESNDAKAPALLHHDLDPATRVLRDLFDETIDQVLIDSIEIYEKCAEFVSLFSPEMVKRIQFYDGKMGLFERFGVEQAIEKALHRKIWLPSGGYIVIDQTEALVSIDVNTGRYVGDVNLEETVLQNNIEAAKAIAYQVRLRGMGGIIVIDFIDMEKQENQSRVLETLRDAFKVDRARVHISEFTEMGLVEITRKRLKQSLQRTALKVCPYCHGYGFVKHPQIVAFQVFKQIQSSLEKPGNFSLEVNVHPSVKPFLDRRMEKISGLLHSRCNDVYIHVDATFHVEYFSIRKF